MASGPFHDGETVALDTMAFAYLIERHPRYVGSVSSIFTRIAEGELRGVASSLVLAELLVPYVKLGSEAHARSVARGIRALPNLEIAPVTAEIAEHAARLRAGFGLRTPDAVHLATAYARGAAWFLTSDRRLQRASTDGCAVCLLDDLSK